MQNANIGSDLTYTLAERDGVHPNAVGERRPAKVVRAWGSGLHNVVVFLDGSNDSKDGALMLWKTSIPIKEPSEAGPGTLTWSGVNSKWEPEAKAEEEPAEGESAEPSGSDTDRPPPPAKKPRAKRGSRKQSSATA